MRFEVIDDGTGEPLMKFGETDDNGAPVKWADIGEIVDIGVDAQSAAERQRAQGWMRGQTRKLRPVPAEPREVMRAPVTRDVKASTTTKKGAKKTKGA